MPFDLKAGIVRILAADGTTTTGTGFVLSEKGIIATCSHVIQAEKLQARVYSKPEKIEVIFRVNGQRGTARLLPQAWRAAETEDVTLLQLEGPLPPEVVPLSIGCSDGAAGHDLQTFGFPDQSQEEGICGEGRLMDKTTILGIRVLQVKSSEITPGFSGAPIFDMQARRVVGMVTSIAAPDRFGRLADTAFITPAETLISIYPQLVPSNVRPYMGLSPFTEKEAEFFFGRRHLVEGLEEALRARPRFLLVMGPSGSGKSSVVQAGLIPQLRRGSVPGSDRWGIILAQPADRPFDNLERAGLRGAFAGLAEAARGWISRNPGQEKLLVILDQFEEFLVTCPSDIRRNFWSELEDLLDSDIEIYVLAVMRDDFFSRFADDAPPAVLAWTQRGFFQVGSNLEYEELREIIQQPARRVGLHLEEGLTEVIINDVLESSREGNARAGRSTVLPLLEFALTQLWERREQGLLTHHAYQTIGKVTGSLTSWADQVCRSLEKEGRGAVARRILTDLVNLGDEKQRLPDSRRQRRLADFLHDENDENERETVQKVVQRLADARLVTTYLDNGEETVQIIHDSLIREWALLQRWLKKDRSFLAWERELEKDAREWQQTSPSDLSGRDEGRLLRGSRLDEAERWQKEREKDLGEADQEFINASLGLREREREKEERAKAEKERTRWRYIKVLAIIATIALCAAVVAQYQKEQANEKTAEALARSLAAQSEQMRGVAGSLTESVLLAVESMRHKETLEGNTALRRSLALFPLCIAQLEHSDWVNNVAFSPDGRLLATSTVDYNGTVRIWSIQTGKELLRIERNDNQKGFQSASKIAFSPDGRSLATSSSFYNAVRIYDVQTGKELKRLGNDSSLNYMAFSPDGDRLATISNDYTAHLWDVQTGKELLRLENDGSGRAMAFDRDKNRLATASNDNTTLLWDVQTGKEIQRLKHDSWVRMVAFSPDGSKLATICKDRAYLWDAQKGKNLQRLELHVSVHAVEFSPDGRMLATGCDDTMARLWDVETGKELQSLEHHGVVDMVKFSPDGRKLVTRNKESHSLFGNIAARLWDVETGKELQSLEHHGEVKAMTFSPDGSWIATSSTDRMVRLWDVPKNRGLLRLVHNDGVHSVIFSPNGKTLATISVDDAKIDHYYAAHLWDIENGTELRSPEYDGSMEQMAFSLDAIILATVSSDNTTLLWDVQTRKELQRLENHESVWAMAFSPDGRLLATIVSAFAMVIQIFDVQTGKKMKRLAFDYVMSALAFSPDGRWLATGSFDKAARLLDIETGKELRIFKHDGSVNAVAFSPDGRWLATGSSDKTARLWDIQTGREFQRLEHDDSVNAVAFSPDGSKLATGCDDKAAQIWTLNNGKVMDEACSRVTRNMTREEWGRFMDNPDANCLTCPQEGSFNRSSILPWERRECQPCIGKL